MSVEALNALQQQFPAAVERPSADHPALTVPIADLTAALGKRLGSIPVPVAEPVYNQFDHEASWGKFHSREWNERI